MDKIFDTVILGGGPAGLSAAIYSARGANSTLIIDSCVLGGQPTNYLELENYPALGKINGFDLMDKFEDHAKLFGVEALVMQEIISIDLKSNPKNIVTNEYTIKAKTVIIATGAKPMKLGVIGEEEFVGRGVSYCAVCDGAFYKDKVIAVVGGGNSALEEAIYLTKFAQKVYLIHRRNSFRADKIIQKRVNDNPKIEVIFDAVVEKILGKELVNALVLKDTNTEVISMLPVDGVFPYIGITPNVENFVGQVEQDASGFIITDCTMQTSVPGVFAVGDVRNTPLRQVITAASDGAVGAVYATKYLESLSETIQVV
mgnify:CR=1 FL=1